MWLQNSLAQMVKNLLADAGHSSSIPGLGRSPEEGARQYPQYSLPGNPMDRMAGYSPWGQADTARLPFVLRAVRVTTPGGHKGLLPKRWVSARPQVTGHELN